MPVISKLFEKLVFNQLYQYMKENGLFTSDQSGFLRLHSTLTCLLKMSDDWYNGLDLGKLVGLLFIDNVIYNIIILFKVGLFTYSSIITN